MSYIDRDLLPGEHLVYRTRLYWLVFAGPVLLSIVVLLPIAWLLFNSNWMRFSWIPLALSALLIGIALLRRQTSDFAVTDRRVVMKRGIISTLSIELLLNKIEAIAIDQSLLGRMFDYGDIIVTGSGGTRELFRRIQAPFEFRRAVQSVTTERMELMPFRRAAIPSEMVYRLRSRTADVPRQPERVKQ